MTNIHEINLEQAIDYTTRYRAAKALNYPISEAFDVTAVQRLLAAPGCAYLRIYLGMKPTGEVICILVAADLNKEDLLSTENNMMTTEADSFVILEDGFRCPQDCPKTSPLN